MANHLTQGPIDLTERDRTEKSVAEVHSSIALAL